MKFFRLDYQPSIFFVKYTRPIFFPSPPLTLLPIYRRVFIVCTFLNRFLFFLFPSLFMIPFAILFLWIQFMPLLCNVDCGNVCLFVPNVREKKVHWAFFFNVIFLGESETRFNSWLHNEKAMIPPSFAGFIPQIYALFDVTQSISFNDLGYLYYLNWNSFDSLIKFYFYWCCGLVKWILGGLQKTDNFNAL